MAGAGYKLFNTGDVLTAAQVNTYLMEQTVMVFANAAARTTALSGVVSEGMISYLKDTNAVEVYDGSNWVSSDDPNAIQNSIINAKGDLIVGSANDTPSILSVSSDGSTLVADSSTSTGLRYTPGNPIANPIINAACEIAQRGTASLASNAATNQFVLDRWNVFRAVAGATFSRQNTNDTTNLPNIRYCIRAQRDSGNTATNVIWVTQNVETVNTIPFVGKTVTLSLYARAGANYSAGSNSLSVFLYTGTGTDQNLLSGYTGSTTTINSSATLTTTWQRFTFTATIPTSATQMGFACYYAPTGTAGANDFFEITGVQIDLGSVALPFRTNGATLAGELAACQRYYVRFSDSTTLFAPFVNAGISSSTTNSDFYVPLPVTMRTKPSSVDFSTVRTYDYVANAGYAISAITLATTSQPQMPLISATMATATAGRFVIMGANNSASAFLGFSAEL